MNDHGCQALPNFPVLCCLNLSGNSLHRGLTALPYTSLQKLDLTRNQLNDEGAERTVAACSKCTRLTYLNLFNNNIRNQGALAITKALPQFRTLERLDIRNNKFGTVTVCL